MSKIRTIRCMLAIAAPLAAAPVLLSGGAAGADEAAFSRFYSAIQAAELCENRNFSQQDHENMAAVINEMAGGDIGVGTRLSLMDKAQSDTKDLVFKYKCDSESVASLLDTFHNELEPSL